MRHSPEILGKTGASGMLAAMPYGPLSGPNGPPMCRAARRQSFPVFMLKTPTCGAGGAFYFSAATLAGEDTPAKSGGHKNLQFMRLQKSRDGRRGRGSNVEDAAQACIVEPCLVGRWVHQAPESCTVT
jgi:hypothetical protein